VGQIYYGAWDSGTTYLYDTGSLAVVSRSGQWYDIVSSSTNKDPIGVGATNYWAESITKGANGTVASVSNIVDRGAWSSGSTYTNFDMVTYDGSLFYVGETNSQPSIGVAPPVTGASQGYDNNYWICRAARGDKGDTGLTGAAGTDGAVTTNILKITYNVLLDTNVYEWTNEADTTNRVPVFSAAVGGTNQYTWVPDSDIAAGAESWSGYAATNTVDLDSNAISNGIFYGDGSGLTNLASGGSSTGIFGVVYASGGTTETNAGIVSLTPSGGGGGVSTIPLNGSSALDWGVLNATMERVTSNGYSTIVADNDTFSYTDSLQIYSLTGGAVSVCYIGAWCDTNNATVTQDIYQQVSIDNGSTWSNYITGLTFSNTPTVYPLTNNPNILSGVSLYRFAAGTNSVTNSMYFYLYDARGQL